MDGKKKKYTRKIFIVMIIALILLTFSVIFSLMNINNTTILEGISINGIDISGMTKEEAEDTLSKLINEKTSKGVTISIADNTQNVSFESLGVEYHISSSISKAYNIGRSENIFKDSISNFTAKYDISNKDRTTNLELAASKINGIILAPGEEFSYNTVVGARTISAGYKEDKIYSNGEVVDGIGGICQISTTLYNAVIYANLNVTERHNHQFVTSYVPAGRDATVVYGSKDLKFVNNRSYPIKIGVKVSNGIVSCTIYGIKEEVEYNVDFDIETVSETPSPVKYEQDKSLAKDAEIVKQTGANGIEVNVYKVEKLDGTIISKDLISQDKYNALEKIILTN